MIEGFNKTLATAAEAGCVAALLSRVARKANPADERRLLELAERYSDYADALRESVAAAIGDEASPDQQPLL